MKRQFKGGNNPGNRKAIQDLNMGGNKVILIMTIPKELKWFFTDLRTMKSVLWIWNTGE